MTIAWRSIWRNDECYVRDPSLEVEMVAGVWTNVYDAKSGRGWTDQEMAPATRSPTSCGHQPSIRSHFSITQDALWPLLSFFSPRTRYLFASITLKAVAVGVLVRLCYLLPFGGCTDERSGTDYSASGFESNLTHAVHHSAT